MEAFISATVPRDYHISRLGRFYCIITLYSFDQLFSHGSQPKNSSPDLILSRLFGIFRYFFHRGRKVWTVGRNYKYSSLPSYFVQFFFDVPFLPRIFRVVRRLDPRHQLNKLCIVCLDPGMHQQTMYSATSARKCRTASAPAPRWLVLAGSAVNSGRELNHYIGNCHGYVYLTSCGTIRWIYWWVKCQIFKCLMRRDAAELTTASRQDPW